MDDHRTIKRFLIGCVSLLLAIVPIVAQGQNVLGQVIQLPKTKGTIYQLLGLVTDQSGYLFIYDSKIIDNEQDVSLKGGHYTIREAIYEITGNKQLAIRTLDNHLLLYLPDTPPAPISTTVPADSESVYFSIEGTLLDHDTKEPIAFGSVGVTQAAIGTITNQNGEFKLRLPDSLKVSEVQFSHIGYQPLEVDCQQLMGKHNQLTLEPKMISIQEVIIRRVNPRRLLEEMLEAQKRNYSQHPVYLTTFYREGIERNKKGFVSLTEAIFKVYKTPYNKFNSSADQVKRLQMRRIFNEQERDTMITKMKSGINACLQLDLIKQLPDFLVLDTDPLYQYAHTDITVIDNRTANVISFEQRPGLDLPLYQGEIYIDNENNALLRVNFEVNPKYIAKAAGMFVEKKSKSLRIIPQKVSYTISYKSWDGVYYINHIRGDLYFKIKKRRQLFNTNMLHTWFEMVTCKIDTVGVNRFTHSETQPTRTVFSDTHFTYDESFWGNFNVILPEEKLNEAISKITSKIEETKE